MMIVVFLATLLIIWYFLFRKGVVRKAKAETAPEAAGAWPVFGHLPLLRGPTPCHVTLGAMADQYGPIFTIRLGSHRALVVSSSEMAKECFTINDSDLVSRPKMVIGKHIGYNYAMFAFAPHGPYWREIRKITTVELLSRRRLEFLKHIRLTEVATFVKELHKHWKLSVKSNNDDVVLVEMKQWFWDLNLNVILRMIAGKRYSAAHNDDHGKEGRQVQRAVQEFLALSGSFVPGDVIPYLGWFDLGGYEKAMKKTAKELDGILTEWLDQHKRDKEVEEGYEDGSQQDFMDVMISLLEGSDLGGYDADTINKATCFNLIAGGSDTITVTLTWAISLLLNNRQVLKKALEELNSHVGKGRLVNESDIDNLSYIQAIVKETLRLYPAAPISAPRIFEKDCTVGGHCVPIGTWLIPNIWKIQTDPVVWPDPFKFDPERFLTTQKNADVRGQNFELIPFGSGRRACPGLNFALQMVPFTLASFLHAFLITTPQNAPVDMTESFGLTNIKATPLNVMITPRLPAELYVLEK
ncbi:cytochrome P450 CYP82D47-like [Humulus lupulus]|uniref:cytochrome P450 CYP82D47-like n=1 Tax=Humulus lupulus TaxID=3486 RepID=UPI002B412382|nr:cytochrome P450 CYP82D47-like [Humulus lupulus]